MQPNKMSKQSLINTSHATSFCSFADVYRPKYGVLENVRGIASEGKGKKAKKDDEGTSTEEETSTDEETASEEENSTEEGINTEEETSTDKTTSESATQSGSVLSRMIACLVSMGYQVNYFKMHSERYGSYQRRQRIILTIAAPGLTPIAEPKATHSTLEANQAKYKSKATKSLGKFTRAPFKQFNAGDGIGGLPNIDRGTVHECIRYPDHRLPNWSRTSTRENHSNPPPGECLLPKEKSQRICKCHLLPTVLTSNGKNSAGWSAGLHYDQLRPLTIQEARRGQGWPDEEVIVGTPQQQYAIVGNGVDRSVSFALGLSLFQSVKNDTTVEIGRSGFSGLQDDQLPMRVARPNYPQKQAEFGSHLSTRLRTASLELDDDNVRHGAATRPTRTTRRIAASPATTKSTSTAPKENSATRPPSNPATMGSASSTKQRKDAQRDAQETTPRAGPPSTRPHARLPGSIRPHPSRTATATPHFRQAQLQVTEPAPNPRRARKRCGNKELSAIGIPPPALRQPRSELDGDVRELRTRRTTRAISPFTPLAHLRTKKRGFSAEVPAPQLHLTEDPAPLAGEDAASAPPRKKQRVSRKEVGSLESSVVLSSGERRVVVVGRVWGGDVDRDEDEDEDGDEDDEDEDEDEDWEE